MKKFLKYYFFFSIIVSNVTPAYAVQQCIQAPKRVYACDNLIYTSIQVETESRLVCICKPDKESILTLLEKDDIATQRIMIRKFLSKYQLSQDEITNILIQIN